MNKTFTLSPSAAERWFNCPGSEYIIDKLPRLPSTPAADEGTLAHTFAAWSLAKTLVDATGIAPINGMPEEPNHALANEEMQNAAQVYADSVFSKLCSISSDFSSSGFEYGIEARCEYYCRYNNNDINIHGRIDFYAIVNGSLVVADFKYGGSPVTASGNKQMLTYAACICMDKAVSPNVSIGIIQPRSEISDFSDFGAVWKDYTFESFTHAFNPIANAAGIACNADDKTERATGDWCKYCAARSVCRASIGKKLLLAGIAAGEAQMHEDATNDQIGAWLNALKEIENARDDLARIAKARIQNGEKIPGWRMQSRKSSQWSHAIDEVKTVDGQAEVLQSLTGLNKDLFIKKVLRTVADIKKTVATDELNQAVEITATTALVKEK